MYVTPFRIRIVWVIYMSCWCFNHWFSYWSMPQTSCILQREIQAPVIIWREKIRVNIWRMQRCREKGVKIWRMYTEVCNSFSYSDSLGDLHVLLMFLVLTNQTIYYFCYFFVDNAPSRMQAPLRSSSRLQLSYPWKNTRAAKAAATTKAALQKQKTRKGGAGASGIGQKRQRK